MTVGKAYWIFKQEFRVNSTDQCVPHRERNPPVLQRPVSCCRVGKIMCVNVLSIENTAWKKMAGGKHTNCCAVKG